MDITRQNFISVDGISARNSFDTYFTVGDVVSHQDTEVGTATIIGFELDIPRNEVRVNTDRGYAHIDFIDKI